LAAESWWNSCDKRGRYAPSFAWLHANIFGVGSMFMAGSGTRLVNL